MNAEHRCLFCDHTFTGRRRKFCFDCLPDYSESHPKAYQSKYMDLYRACGLNPHGGAVVSPIPKDHPARPTTARTVQQPVNCAFCEMEFVPLHRGNRYCSKTCASRNFKRATTEKRHANRAAVNSASPPALPNTSVEVVVPAKYGPHTEGGPTNRQSIRLVLRMWPVGTCSKCDGPLQPWWDLYPGAVKRRTYCYVCHLEQSAKTYAGRQAATGTSAGAIVKCLQCSAQFQRNGRRKLYCSAECRRQGQRDSDRRQNMKRRGAKRGQPYTLRQVFDRDAGKCHLCSKSVDLTLPGTAPMGASVDHLLPVVDGGVDCLTNVALAHLSCNIKRGTKGVVQLRLVG